VAVEVSEGIAVGEDVIVAVGGIGVLVGSGARVGVEVEGNCRVGASGEDSATDG